MKKVRVRIEGISELLMHRFATETSPKSKKKDNLQTSDNVENYLYKDSNGKLAQPADHIIGTLKRAGAKFQIPGQRKATYSKIMGSGAIIIEPSIITHEVQKWETDTRPVVVNKGRIIRSRPKLSKWALTFDIEYDDDEISKEALKEILDYAGRRVGIGDYRPDKGGPFGRFIVTKFD